MTMKEERTILGYRLVPTCGGCPEQYDVFMGETRAGYMRLRWGHFRVDLGGNGGPCVYAASVGDGLTGNFPDEEERERHLTLGCAAIFLVNEGRLTAPWEEK